MQPCSLTRLLPTDIVSKWSAVVRGAAAKGLEGDTNAVVMRKSRRHYGTSCNPIFVEGQNLECDSYWDTISCNKRASGQAKWLINKYQDLHVVNATHAAIDITVQFWPNKVPGVTTSLLACDANRAPSRSIHPVSNLRPELLTNLTKNQSVYKVATLTVNLKDVPSDCIKHNRNPAGRHYNSIYAQVHISMQSSLEFFVTVNGKRYGTVHAAYE